jgi:pimeloyl-ACP methyl ester carboxylesterase
LEPLAPATETRACAARSQPPPDDPFPGDRRRRGRAGSPRSPEFVREFQLETTALPLEPALLDIFVQESRKLPAATWRAAFDVFIRSDITPLLRAVSAPTVLVWGEYDTFSDRAEQERILAAVPNSRLLEYKDTGHAIHWDRPERFAHDLAAFVHEVAEIR